MSNVDLQELTNLLDKFVMQPLSERLTKHDDTLKDILDQTKKTNGRVTALEGCFDDVSTNLKNHIETCPTKLGFETFSAAKKEEKKDIKAKIWDIVKEGLKVVLSVLLAWILLRLGLK